MHLILIFFFFRRKRADGRWPYHFKSSKHTVLWNKQCFQNVSCPNRFSWTQTKSTQITWYVLYTTLPTIHYTEHKERLIYSRILHLSYVQVRRGTPQAVLCCPFHIPTFCTTEHDPWGSGSLSWRGQCFNPCVTVHFSSTLSQWHSPYNNPIKKQFLTSFIDCSRLVWQGGDFLCSTRQESVYKTWVLGA